MKIAITACLVLAATALAHHASPQPPIERIALSARTLHDARSGGASQGPHPGPASSSGSGAGAGAGSSSSRPSHLENKHLASTRKQGSQAIGKTVRPAASAHGGGGSAGRGAGGRTSRLKPALAPAPARRAAVVGGGYGPGAGGAAAEVQEVVARMWAQLERRRDAGAQPPSRPSFSKGSQTAGTDAPPPAHEVGGGRPRLNAATALAHSHRPDLLSSSAAAPGVGVVVPARAGARAGAGAGSGSGSAPSRLSRFRGREVY